MRIRSVVLAGSLAVGLAVGPALQAQAATPALASSAAKAGLEAHIARDIKVLDDVRSESHDLVIPADQRRGYAATIAVVIHLRATTYARSNILAQRTAAQLASLTTRWNAYHQEIVDLRAAVDLADDYTGGFIDATGPDFAAVLTQLQAALQTQAATGADITAATAALTRVPADIVALNAQAQPYFAKLARADFRRHAVVALQIKQCTAVVTTGAAIVALDNDLLTVFKAAYPSLSQSAQGQAFAHAG